jgi:hypothetical protein
VRGGPVTWSAAAWILAAAAPLLAFSGCSAARIVEIDSRPADAREASVYVDGERRGVTPTKVRLDFGGDPNQRILIQVVKPNYKPAFQYWTVLEVPEQKRVFELEDE